MLLSTLLINRGQDSIDVYLNEFSRYSLSTRTGRASGVLEHVDDLDNVGYSVYQHQGRLSVRVVFIRCEGTNQSLNASLFLDSDPQML